MESVLDVVVNLLPYLESVLDFVVNLLPYFALVMFCVSGLLFCCCVALFIIFLQADSNYFEDAEVELPLYLISNAIIMLLSGILLALTR